MKKRSNNHPLTAVLRQLYITHCGKVLKTAPGNTNCGNTNFYLFNPPSREEVSKKKHLVNQHFTLGRQKKHFYS